MWVEGSCVVVFVVVVRVLSEVVWGSTMGLCTAYMETEVLLFCENGLVLGASSLCLFLGLFVVWVVNEMRPCFVLYSLCYFMSIRGGLYEDKGL